MACPRLPIGGILALLLCWLGSACRSDTQDASPIRNSEFRRGEGVVVEASAGVFFEGRVLATGEGANLRVQKFPGGDIVTAARHDAYSLAHNGGARVGEHAICRVGKDSWVACRIDAIEGERLTASTADGRTHAIADSDVIVPTAVTHLNVTQLFVRTRRHAEFRRAFMRAGSPRAPPGWSPEARDPVVVRRQDQWFSARIRSASDGGAFVEVSGSRSAELVRMDWVVPLPPYDHPFRAGQFALLAPAVLAEPWRAVRVEEVSEDGVDVADASGVRETVPARELVPLVD